MNDVVLFVKSDFLSLLFTLTKGGKKEFNGSHHDWGNSKNRTEEIIRRMYPKHSRGKKGLSKPAFLGSSRRRRGWQSEGFVLKN